MYETKTIVKGDKFTAVWVSHSSISDFLACPRSYFLKNVYRDPKSNRKITLASPALALGQAVHEVVESLSVLHVDQRFNTSLVEKFDSAWQKVAGKKGGFFNEEMEQHYKNRGLSMLERVRNNPGPLKNLAVKIKMDLPYYWLSEEDNIILCGKVDWLEYLPESDSVHIIDFKTSKSDEKPESLQLPIYALIVSKCQARPVSKMSYWYIDRKDEPTEVEMPDLDEVQGKVLRIARNMKAARKLERFKCTHETGCYACDPYEAILRGEAENVGIDEFDHDVYVLKSSEQNEMPESEII